MKKISYWDTLKDENRPIILYGTGNGADKILDACEAYGIKVSAVFASNGFVRDRVFRGMKVLSYDDVREAYGDDIVILLGFGTTLPGVMDFIERLDASHELIIPEVPLYGSGIFDTEYLESKRCELEEVYSWLSDDFSRSLFYDTVMFRLTGKLEYLKRCEPVIHTLAGLSAAANIECALDGGAFKGDSASDMLDSFPHIKKIIACEPDPSTFKKLSAYAEDEASRGVVCPVNSALGSEAGDSDCVSSGSRGSGIEGRNRRAKNVTIKVDTVDNICAGEKIDYLKLDVEGFEREALLGAVMTIKRDRPTLAVSLYHRTGDLTELVLLTRELLGECDMYLRRPECVPMWDLTLYAVPK